MTDDMGNNLGNLGNPWLKTPNIDKLSEESVLLTNFHQDLLCTPSRASLMTGKYSLRTGAWRTSIGRSNMRSEEITVAEVFQKMVIEQEVLANGTWEMCGLSDR